MKNRSFISSLVATIMVMDMLIVAFAAVPLVNLGGPPPVVGDESAPAVQQAGLFGCIWACIKCVGTVGKNGKACRKCAGCLGDDNPGDETAE